MLSSPPGLFRPPAYSDTTILKGDRASTAVQSHPDGRVQLVLEQIREAETVQAIDRLRLLRGNSEAGNRQVFLLSSVPLDITVDHLWGWKRLQRALELWREADGVLPLDAPSLLKRCPSVGSEATARRVANDIKPITFLIRYIIRNMSVSLDYYHKAGQNKQFSALVDASLDETSLVEELSRLAGHAVELVKK